MEDEEISQWLGAHTIFVEDCVLFGAPTFT